MKLRVALVGAGRMAGFIDREVGSYSAIKVPFSHAAAYDVCEETEMAAVCATKEESVNRFKKRWNIPKGYLDYKEMIIQEKPDILSIVTHAALHGPIAIFAAQNGVKAIYCEKPIAMSLEESDRIIEVCKENGVKVLVGHLRRFHDVYKAARDYIKSGELGNLVCINSIHTGELFHTGTHNFDLLNMMVDDKAEWVQASIDLSPNELKIGLVENDAAGVGIIRYTNGVTAFVHARGRRPGLFDQEFICEEGLIRVYNNGVDWELRRIKEYQRPVPKDGPKWLHVPPVSISKQEKVPFDTKINSTTLAAVENLTDAIKIGTSIMSTAEDAKDALEIGIGFLHSEREEGRRIHIPLQDRSMVVKAR